LNLNGSFPVAIYGVESTRVVSFNSWVLFFTDLLKHQVNQNQNSQVLSIGWVQTIWVFSWKDFGHPLNPPSCRESNPQPQMQCSNTSHTHATFGGRKLITLFLQNVPSIRKRSCPWKKILITYYVVFQRKFLV
jgi:hypothetical protein